MMGRFESCIRACIVSGPGSAEILRASVFHKAPRIPSLCNSCNNHDNGKFSEVKHGTSAYAEVILMIVHAIVECRRLSWLCDSHAPRQSAVAENGAGGCVFRLAGDKCGVDSSVLVGAPVRAG